VIYLLDTNACINFLNVRDSLIRRRLTTLQPDDVVLCSVVKAELYRGAYRSTQRESNLTLLERLSSQFVSLPFDDLAAEVYGRIRAELEAIGMLIGPYDMMIAAITLANDLTLVTHNTREFGRVAGLKIEDWEVSP
jgi:tRNA(fMet)-specific endonuclease VapC